MTAFLAKRCIRKAAETIADPDRSPFVKKGLPCRPDEDIAPGGADPNVISTNLVDFKRCHLGRLRPLSDTCLIRGRQSEGQAMRHTTPVQTFVIPGFAGSPEGHWQHIWAEERPHARMIMQENWYFPQLEAWASTLERALLAAENPVFLVAHSLGCILAARIGEGPAAHKVRGALLVAPGDLDVTERLHPGLIRFGAMPERALPFPSVLLGSRNDSYMSEERARYFGGRWGAHYVDMGYVGHINLASGFGRFEHGYRLFDTLLAPSAAEARLVPQAAAAITGAAHPSAGYPQA